MNNLSKFLMAIVVDAWLVFMYYLWQINGITQAGNLFIFWVWFIGIVGTLMIFVEAKAKDYRPMPLYFKIFNRISSVAIVVGTIWAGHSIAAVFYIIACFIGYILHARQKDLWESAK